MSLSDERLKPALNLAERVRGFRILLERQAMAGFCSVSKKKAGNRGPELWVVEKLCAPGIDAPGKSARRARGSRIPETGLSVANEAIRIAFFGGLGLESVASKLGRPLILCVRGSDCTCAQLRIDGPQRRIDLWRFEQNALGAGGSKD